MTANLSYVAKWYHLSKGECTGRVSGVFTLWIAGWIGSMIVVAYMYLNCANSAVVGGVMPVLAAVCWWYMEPLNEDDRHPEKYSFWD